MNRVKLSSIIDIISGGTPKTDVAEYWEGGTIGWLSVTDFNNDLRFVYDTEKKITESGLKNSNTKLLRKGDIIISARGTVGALAQIGTPMCFNQSCFGLRGKKNIADSDFLYYCLKNYVQNIKKRSQGSVFDTINLKSFDIMEIEIPKKITTQQQIASVLSSLDSKIELNNRINAELEAMAKTVYDYWFVQFDFPFDFTQGKPSAEGKPYKSSGGKMVWSEELKREVPEGWEVDNLFKIANLEGGGTPSKIKNEYWGGNIPFYTPSDYNNEVFVMDTESSITKSGLENCSSKLFPKRTIFITARGTVGNIAITAKDTAMNQSCYAFCNHKEYSYTYLYYTVKSLINSLKAKSAGSVFNSIVTNDIKFTRITIAPKTLVKQYSDIVEPLFAKILLNQQENQQLSSLRDWLLPMLMNGQVKVGSGYEGEVESLMAAEAGEKYGK